MKSKLLLLALVFSTLVLFGFQALGPSKALALTASVDIKPETIYLDRKGRWITVFISLEGYSASDIDGATILLEGQFRPEWSNTEGDKLMVKFDGSSVTDYLWERLYHMGPRTSVELGVTGQLRDGTNLSGSDTVTVMKA